MSNLVKKLQQTDRCYCGSKVIDGELKLVACLFHQAAAALEPLTTEHRELRGLYTEVSDRAYKRLSQLRDAQDRIEQLEAALREIAGAKVLTAKSGDESTKAWNHDKMIETAERALEIAGDTRNANERTTE